MSKLNKKKGIETVRTRMGLTFIIPWILGLALFFLYPLINSIWYGFNDVRIEPGKITTYFKGLKNFYQLIVVDPNFLDDLRDSIGMMLYSLPVIISLSLILAVLLNQNFKGRAVFRSIFFFPVIIANSVVMNLLNGEFVKMPLFSLNQSGTGLINYNQIISELNIPSQINPILVFLLSNTISLIWKCGVQTILFLAGLQSISPSLYEVSKIEGANKWEEFWLVTVPSLRHIISLVMIYTMIELFTANENLVVSKAYKLMVKQDFGNSSAMLWMYFLFVITIIGGLYALYQKLCVKQWE